MENKKIKFLGVFFEKRDSRKKEGEKCWIGGVRKEGEKSDSILIADEHLMDKRGKWDVEVIAMKSGKGFIVTSAQFSPYDRLTLERGKYKVRVLTNGREEPLRTEDKMRIPITFDRENWYEPKKIVKNIRRKMEYLTLEREFDREDFIARFLRMCDKVSSDYREDMKGGRVDGDLNLSQLEKFKQKFGR